MRALDICLMFVGAGLGWYGFMTGNWPVLVCGAVAAIMTARRI